MNRESNGCSGFKRRNILAMSSEALSSPWGSTDSTTATNSTPDRFLWMQCVNTKTQRTGSGQKIIKHSRSLSKGFFLANHPHHLSFETIQELLCEDLSSITLFFFHISLIQASFFKVPHNRISVMHALTT